MGDLEIEIYMSNFRTFFEKNDKEGKQIEPTRQQMIDLILELNGVPSDLEKLMPTMSHHMGIICLN